LNFALKSVLKCLKAWEAIFNTFSPFFFLLDIFIRIWVKFLSFKKKLGPNSYKNIVLPQKNE
jgi:hypothetical protein